MKHSRFVALTSSLVGNELAALRHALADNDPRLVPTLREPRPGPARIPKRHATLPLQILLENLLHHDGHAAGAPVGQAPAGGIRRLRMDSPKSFLEMGKPLGVATSMFVTTKEKPADFHVQNVDSYHERLKTWIDHKMRGMASKYMPSYLAWQRLKTWKAMSSAGLVASALGRPMVDL